jgi:hypothetical protein
MANSHYYYDIEDSIAFAVNSNINAIIITGEFNYDALINNKNIFFSQHFRMEQIIEDLTHLSLHQTKIQISISGVRGHIFINRVTIFQYLVFLISETKTTKSSVYSLGIKSWRFTKKN